jgi:adenylate cyclase
MSPLAAAQDLRLGLARNWSQILTVFGVFALFALKATGVFELALELGESASTYPAILAQPEYLTLLAVGLVLSLLLPLLSPIKASVLTFACMLPVVYFGYRVQAHRPLVPMEYSLLTILMVFVVNVLVSYFTETRRKQKLLEVFGQYVPEQVARAVARDPSRLSMQGESRQITVMFCDVHDFTSISEKLAPRELVDMLNTLFTPLSRIIQQRDGVIDKYMGDAIMAFWGAPICDPHQASKALAAAFEMHEAVDALGARFAARGWPQLRVGIGVNTGVVNVGNMGSAYRVAYTVIGDAVNLAARLQDLTRVFRAPVICGEATRRAFPALTYRELGLVQVKGKSELARIYEPCNPATDPASTIAATMHRHNQALHQYYAHEWDVAAQLFEQIKAAQPEDPLYDYYLGRIAEFRQAPPPEGWQGELRFQVT